MTRKRAALGKLVARVLRGAWRSHPPELDILESELDQVVPLLLASGGAALGWWRVRHSNLRNSPAALELQQAYRLHSLQSALHESEIKDLLTLAHRAGAQPVLVKGWAVAMLYPEMGLRPYGDIDLCFEEKNYAKAAAALERLDRKKYQVDLHEGFSKLDDLSTAELLIRSQSILIGGEEVRVLGAEDHIRILCTHALRHGAWRPLWFCDIAAAVESRPADFDWDRCLGPDALTADWVACAIGLAHTFLGADVKSTPVERRANQLPGWLMRRTMKNWSAPYPGLYPPLSYTRPFASYFRDPRGLLGTLLMRWPDPIEATIRMRGAFNESPRWPYQVRNAADRIISFLGELARSEPKAD